MRTNVLPKQPPILTHEGAKAVRITPEQELRRTVMACMLWEDSFYEDGVSVADRIADLVTRVKPAKIAAIAIEARGPMKLRHVPLKLCAELSKNGHLKAETLAAVIQRADELAEYCSILQEAHPGKTLGKILGNQSRKGLALAFQKFDEYALAKYDRAGKVRLRDVLFLSHAKPKDDDQAALWKRLVDNKLTTPDTWEVELSASTDKTSSWRRLLTEKKLGALALLRNLRNLVEAGIDRSLVQSALAECNAIRVLPFRFIAAAKAAPKFEKDIDALMLRTLAQASKLPGKTIIIVDVSGSMYGSKVSAKSDMDRALAACALAAIGREVCEESVIYATAGNDCTRKHQTKEVPARHGMALADAIFAMCRPLGGGGIFLKQVMDYVYDKEKTADRVIVISDEQDCDLTGSPASAKLFAKRHYMLNVNTYKNGIAYGPWTNISGFSEAVIDYIRQSEIDEQ